MSALPANSASRPPNKPMGRARKVGLVGLALVSLLGLTSGFSGLLIFAGIYMLSTGAWALLRRSSWLGNTKRPIAGGVLAGGLVMTMVGGAVAAPADAIPPAAVSADATPPAAAPQSASTIPSTSPTPSPSSTPSPTATAMSLEELAAALPAPELAPDVDVESVASTAVPQTALATAALLEVKGRAPKTGYSRDLFGSGWIDVNRNGCDTRNDILARDLTEDTLKAGTNSCVVLTGLLADPYSSSTIAFVRGAETSNAVQIDHVVALSDAWQKGAQQWDEAKRVGFANDPMNLLAVDGPLNMQKGDGDTATWLPPNKPYRCAYVARQVGVKYTYGLWVTEAERTAMVSVLSNCPDEPLPAGSVVPPAPAPAPEPAPAPAPAPEPAPAPAPEPAPAPAPAPAVYYKNCTAARDAGAAPVLLGQPGYGTHLDRDGDGIGCEN